MKPKILIIQTGGTISQEKGEDGTYSPSSKPIKEMIRKINSLEDLAEITIEELFNIDSTNMETFHRAKLAEKIYENYQEYDGFVILHGTDTLADSAAAVNYMLQGSGKPIVFTGSQKPIFEPASDAPNNVYNAVKIATLDIGEMVIAFGNKIVRGVRAVKESEHGLNAFSSPKIEPLGEIGREIFLKDHIIQRHEGKPALFTDFDTRIEHYQQSSGAITNVFENLVEDEEIHGIIINAYGAGNVQERLIPIIARATVRIEKPVLVVTNCKLGAANNTYKAGFSPLVAGAISAGDMTLEAATQKLMYALGISNKQGYQRRERLDFVKEIIHTNYNGDIKIDPARYITRQGGIHGIQTSIS